MPWDAAVHTSFVFDDVPAQARNKVNEVAQGQGRNGNGNTKIDSHNYQHWRAGDYRVFGSWAVQAPATQLRRLWDSHRKRQPDL